MLARYARILGCLMPFLGMLPSKAAFAACALPNNLTNGQTADASQVMGNFNAVTTCMDNNGSVATGSAGQIGAYTGSGNQISGQSLSGFLDTTVSSTQGTIIYRGASGWQALGPSAPGYVLGTNGSGADPAWVPPGSGGVFGLFFDVHLTSALARSTHMNVIHTQETITIKELSSMLTTVTGATYKMGIASWDPVNLKVTTPPVYTPSKTAGTGAPNTPLYFTFSSPLSIPAGNYAVILVRTDGTPTTSLTLNYGSGFIWGPQLYMTGTSTSYGIANQSPSVSDVWTSEGSGSWALAMMYQ